MIHRYHQFNEHQPLTFCNSNETETATSKKSNIYLGVELETDSYPYNRETSVNGRTIADQRLMEVSEGQKLFHLERDGSLTNGIELVTTPATLRYHRKKMPWRDITNIVNEAGGKSHDSGNCGLHIHFNRDYFGNKHDINALKLVYMFEKHWQKFWEFSRRKSSHYCDRYGTLDFDWVNPGNTLRYLRSQGRYYAVNLQNTNTIEIRIFRGTTRYETLMACIEMVDYLARHVYWNTLDTIQNETWEQAFGNISKAHPYLRKYMVERNLI